MNRTMKLVGIALCVALFATLATPVLAFAFPIDGNRARQPWIFLDNSTAREKIFWPMRAQNLTHRPVTALNSATMQSQLDAANNLTKFLEEKGYPVQGLRNDLDSAATAIQENNVSAFRGAARTYLQDLHTEIKNGSIDKTVLAEYIQSNHPGRSIPANPWVKVTTRVIDSMTFIPRWIVHHMIFRR